MAVWLKRVDLSAEYERYEGRKAKVGEQAAVQEFAKTAVTKLRKVGAPEALLKRLSRVKTERGFNTAWDAVYDWADWERVWVEV